MILLKGIFSMNIGCLYILGLNNKIQEEILMAMKPKKEIIETFGKNAQDTG